VTLSNPDSRLIQLPWRGRNGVNAGLLNVVPVDAVGSGNSASFADGFPIQTMVSPDLGGVPPSGADINGLLNQLTALMLWDNAGGQWRYNAALAAAIGGYPIGATLQLSDNATTVLCTSAGNLNDPNSNLNGWQLVGNAALIDSTLANGDALVRVLQPFTGAIARTQHQKNIDALNALDFCVGDGGTDDTAAMQHLLNTGRDVDLSYGVYKCGALFMAADNQKIFSHRGGTIIATSSAIQQITVAGDSQRISGIRFKGVATTSNPTLYFAIYTSATPATNITIDNCYFTGTDASHGWNNGIKLAIDCHGAMIFHNRIDSLWGSADGGYAILVSDSDHCLIHQNIIIGDSATQLRGRHGVYLSAGAQYNSVTNNFIYGTYEAGITHFSQNTQDVCDSNLIAENYVIRCSRAANFAGGGITIGGKSTRCMCLNNIVLESPAKGITLDATNYGTSVAPIAYGNVVRGNKVYNSGSFGITMINQDSFVIADNDIRDSSVGYPGTYPHIGLDNIVGGFGCQNGYVGNNQCNVSVTARSSFQCNAAYAAVNITVVGNKFPVCNLTDIELNGSIIPVDGKLWSVTSWAPGTVNNGASANTTVSVPGAVLNDLVEVTLRGGAGEMVAGLFATGFVASTGNVTVTLGNLSGGNLAVANTVLTVAVSKRQQV